MRKLIYAINLTLDGCVDHTKGEAGEEIHDYHTQLIRGVDTFVYGRKTYDLMVPFWPDIAKNHSGMARSMVDFAQAFDAVRDIVVFSKSMEKPLGKNTKIVRGDLQKEILKLKQESGRDILTGGVDIPSQLIQLDLIDEYRFVFQPFLVGEGRRLLESVSLQKKLKLVDSRTFLSGGIALRFLRS
jgi:dihydrofolate reductase